MVAVAITAPAMAMNVVEITATPAVIGRITARRATASGATGRIGPGMKSGPGSAMMMPSGVGAWTRDTEVATNARATADPVVTTTRAGEAVGAAAPITATGLEATAAIMAMVASPVVAIVVTTATVL